MTTKNVIRTLNNNGGAFEFDGQAVINLTNGKHLNFEQVIQDFFNVTNTEEKIVLSYNRCGIIKYKAATRTDFKLCPELLYFNGNSSASYGFEFGFRFTSKVADFLDSLPDVLDKDGHKLEIPEVEFVKIANDLKNNYNKSCNLGNIAEYVISGNIKDITEPTRKKKHDVYIYVMGKNGELCKSRKAAECKASYAGQKGQALATDLLIWDKKAGQFKMGLSSGYKKSNGAVKYDENMNLKNK